jgi:putative FmdB family regulatory protein
VPLYEYHCRDCEQDFEILVRGSETPHCPQCAGAKLEKLLSVPAAPTGTGQELPLGRPPQDFGGCGRPQCGMGGCQME